MTSRSQADSPALDLVADLHRVIEGLDVAERGTAAAPTRARALAEAAGSATESARLGAVIYAANLLVADETTWATGQVDALLDTISNVTRLPLELVRTVVGFEGLRAHRLLRLPPQQAIEKVLQLLERLAPISELSLWSFQLGERIRCLAYVGEREPTRRARQEARRVIHDIPSSGSGQRRTLRGFPVGGGEQTQAALVIRAKAEDRRRWLRLVEEATETLGLILERQELMTRSVESHAGLVDLLERRLTRLGFDLHDGAIQEITALAADLHFFRRQLEDILSGSESLGPVLGRVEDLEARLRAVETELRDLARSFAERVILQKPFPQVLQTEVESFVRETGIETSVDVDRDLGPLTDSQRIALLRIIREALANVREHSGASRVRIKVAGKMGGVHAAVRDDGCGFDVERTLLGAVKRGRLGLVGMSERARLLGGRVEVRSTPGGPTTVSVTLPVAHPGTMDSARATAPARVASG